MDPVKSFQVEVQQNISNLSNDHFLKSLSNLWLRDAGKSKWSYNFTWLGRPAIQLPNDAWAMQEIIWNVKPDLIIECGIAHGGSLINYASMLALLDIVECLQTNSIYNPLTSKRKVLGIDVDIRSHNKKAIEEHPMYNWISMIEGSSIDNNISSKVFEFAQSYTNVLVCLDSNHTHEHVLAELNTYAPLVSKNSYCCVFDTIVEDMPSDLSSDRPWGPGNSPKTAVHEYLKNNSDFKIDYDIHNKLQITVAPDGYLKRVSS